MRHYATKNDVNGTGRSDMLKQDDTCLMSSRSSAKRRQSRDQDSQFLARKGRGYAHPKGGGIPKRIDCRDHLENVLNNRYRVNFNENIKKALFFKVYRDFA